MPLHELYRMAKGKLDSRDMINTSCAPDQSTLQESDFLELVWENGQISVQGQTSRGNSKKSPTTCKGLPSHCLPSHCTNNNNNNTNNDMMMRMGKFGDLDSGFNELRMPVPSGEEVGLTQDEDEVMPWLNYAVDEPLQHDYSSGLLHELSGVTMNDLPNNANNLSLLDRRSNCNQVFRDSQRNYALSKGSSAVAREVEYPEPKAGTSQFYHPSSHQYQASFASVRSRVSDVTENNATQHAPNCGEITQIFPSASSGFSSLKMMDKQDPIMSSSSSTIMNFSHFARPAAIVKANLQNIGLSSPRSESIGNKNKGAAASAATASNPPESIKVGLSRDSPKESGMNKQQVVEPSKADLKQLEPKSLGGNATFSKQSDPSHKEDASKIDQNSNILHCESSNKGQEPVEKNVEPVVASSSVCSGNGAGRGSDDANQNLKRKRRDAEDSECHSEDVEEVSAGVKKSAPGRGGTGFKRSRSAEVHNLSERRRRDRINEKMRALQELIPNCNKVDKASMLDEAIEYLKTLQLQVQIMSMGAGFYMPPMMLPAGMQHMHPPHMASFSPMGVGMQMGLGMGYGMGMHDINGGSSRFPMMQVPQMQGTHLPVAPMSGPSALHGIGRSNPHMFGVPGQRLTTPMQRAPIFSLPGEPAMNSSAIGLNASGTAGVMENANSASASGWKDPTSNTNSQAIPNANGCNSTTQMTTQCEASAGGFEHTALGHNTGHASASNDGGAVNAVEEDNK